ncbi:threonine synthase [Eubacterium xylanophilum]|uniref:threonine synthase n=1 Tax=Eubacterium xylanophilum TaxID=39497 RepID=UPI00047DDADB|nr:threonine synthase [Eubacterium xylanophilum]
MATLYKSTRSEGTKVTASEAILKGLADDGGLFVPESIPQLDKSLEELSKLGYKETAYEIMKLFFSDFTEEELKYCINGAYDEKFDTDVIAPLVEKDGAYYLELFHGKTIAFKDMALSILPYLMTTSAKKNGVKNEIVILTATSGDTGKAALAGFADVEGTSIIVFYPKNGVSPIQEKQMLTQKGANTKVVGIIGNFDDAQTGVKMMFNSKELAAEMDAKGYQFSSANSINIGRLIPQVVYYVYAYGQLVKEGKIQVGDKIQVVVPTGNFGNILAAYYAKNMGLPIETLYCASNENKVLFDFFETGKYDRKRDFILTTSPSMDILISSNLERLIYLIAGEDAAKTKELMDALVNEGEYTITDDMKAKLSDFVGGYATEDETHDRIKEIYDKTGYIMDTHTAVASAVYAKCAADKDIPTVIASTASPYKFTRSVMNSIDKKYDSMGDFELVDELNKLSGVKVPNAIEEIRSADILHDIVCDKSEMEKTVRDILGI